MKILEVSHAKTQRKDFEGLMAFGVFFYNENVILKVKRTTTDRKMKRVRLIFLLVF